MKLSLNFFWSIFRKKRKRAYLGAKTCDHIFCLFRLLVLGFGCSSVDGLLDLLSSLFYVIRQFDRFLHGGWAQKNQRKVFFNKDKFFLPFTLSF